MADDDLPPGFELEHQPFPARGAPDRAKWLPAPVRGDSGVSPFLLQGDQGPTTQNAPAGSPGPSGDDLPPGYQLETHGNTGVTPANVIRAATQNTGIPGVASAFNRLGSAASAAGTGVKQVLGLPINPNRSQAPTFGQRYTEDLAHEEQAGQAFNEAHPIVSAIAGMAGGTAALAPAAGTGMGMRLLGLTGSLPARIATAGATFGALGAGNALEQGTDPVSGAAIGASLGAAAPVAGRLVGRGVSGITNMLSAPAVRAATEKAAQSIAGASAEPLTAGGAFTSPALGDIARQGYQAIDNAGALIHPQHVGNKISQIFSDLRARNFGPEDQGAVFNRIGRLAKTEPIPAAPPTVGPSVPNLGQIPTPPTTRPAPTSFGDVAAARMRLNDFIRKSPGTSKAAAAGQAIEGLDDLLETITPKDVVAGDPTTALRQLQESNANYRWSKRAEFYDEAIRKAQLSADAGTGSLDLNLRNQFKALRNNKNAMRGASDQEKTALDQIIKGSFTQNTLRQIGKLSPVGHALPMMGELGMVAAGEPVSALTGAVGGAVAKHLSNSMMAGKAARLSASIRAQAPASAQLKRMLPPPRSVPHLNRAANLAAAAFRVQQLRAPLRKAEEGY
jgi:hypothetical protein